MITQLSVEPPAPPRPLTPALRRRSWGLAGVRGWVLLTLVVFGIALYLLAAQVIALSGDWWLVRHGLPVRAEIIDAGGNATANRLYSPGDNVPFKLRIHVPGSAPLEVISRLKDQRIPLGPPMSLTVYVDPNNPSNWTDRQATLVSHDLLLTAGLLPLVLLLGAVALVRRAQALRVWTLGKAYAAVVVSVGPSALAPGGRVLRFVLRDSRDKRAFTTFAPRASDELRQGDVVWVLARPGRLNRALLYYQ